MKRVVCCLMVLLGVGVAGADDKSPMLKTLFPDSVRFAQATSSDRQVSTLIFDNLLLDASPQDESLTNVKRFSYRLDVDSSKDSCVTQHLRGYVVTQGDANASLIVHCNGKTTVVDLKKATEASKTQRIQATEATYKNALSQANQLGIKSPAKRGVDGDYFVAIDTPVKAGRPLLTTILLVTDTPSRNAKDSAALWVDSVDLVVHPAAK